MLEGLYVFNYTGKTPIDDVITAVVRNCRSLKDLCLEGCREVTDDGLLQVAEKCKELEYLNLTWCYAISAEGIQTIIRNCKDLEELELEQCDFKEDGTYSNYSLELDKILINFDGSLPNITSLNLGYCNGISDNALCAISKRSKRLSKMSLRGCDRITDKGIEHLVENCKNMIYLDLGW